MRYDKEVAWKFSGDVAKARQYISQARTVAGEIFSANVNELEQVTRRVQLAEGVWCQVGKTPGQVIIEIDANPAQRGEPKGKVEGFIIETSDGKEGVLQKTDTGWVWIPKAQLTELAYGNVITWMDETRVLSCNGTPERMCMPLPEYASGPTENAEIFLNGKSIQDLPELSQYLGASYYEDKMYVVGLDSSNNIVVAQKIGTSWDVDIVYSSTLHDGAMGCALFADTGEYARMKIQRRTHWLELGVLEIRVGLIPSATLIHQDNRYYDLIDDGATYKTQTCSKTNDPGYDENWTQYTGPCNDNHCSYFASIGGTSTRVSKCSESIYTEKWTLYSPSVYVYAFTNDSVLTFGSTANADINYDEQEQTLNYQYTGNICSGNTCYIYKCNEDCICSLIDAVQTNTACVNSSRSFLWESSGSSYLEHSHVVSADGLGVIAAYSEVTTGTYSKSCEENTIYVCSTLGYACNYTADRIKDESTNDSSGSSSRTESMKIILAYDERTGAMLYTVSNTWVPNPNLGVSSCYQLIGEGTSSIFVKLPSGVTQKIADLPLCIGWYSWDDYYNNNWDVSTTGKCDTTGYLTYACYTGTNCTNYNYSNTTPYYTSERDDAYAGTAYSPQFFPRLHPWYNRALLDGASRQPFRDTGHVSAYCLNGGNADILAVGFQLNQDSAGRWLVSVFLKIQEIAHTFSSEASQDWSSGYSQARPRPLSPLCVTPATAWTAPIYITKNILDGYEGDPTEIMNVEPVPDEFRPDQIPTPKLIPPYFKRVSVTGPRTL